MPNFGVDYQKGATGTADTGAGRSKSIWGDCPIDEILRDNERGIFWGHEFIGLPTSGTDLTRQEADDNAAITLSTSYMTGVLSLDITTDDNEEAYVSSPVPIIKIPVNTSLTSGQKAWFEARVRVSVATECSLICGLGSAAAAANTLGDTHTDAAILDTSDISFLGWICATDTDDYWDAAYRTAADAAHTVHSNQVVAVAADTWVKLGVYFDGRRSLYLFKDGVKYGGALDIAAASVPDNVALYPILGIKNAAAQTSGLLVDWMYAAQLRAA